MERTEEYRANDSSSIFSFSLFSLIPPFNMKNTVRDSCFIASIFVLLSVGNACSDEPAPTLPTAEEPPAVELQEAYHDKIPLPARPPRSSCSTARNFSRHGPRVRNMYQDLFLFLPRSSCPHSHGIPRFRPARTHSLEMSRDRLSPKGTLRWRFRPYRSASRSH